MKLLPQPKKIRETQGEYLVDYRNNIVIGSGCGPNVFLYAKMLQESILKWCGMEMPVLRGKAFKGDILLNIEEGSSKGYLLTVGRDEVNVTGTNEELLLNGIQTLRQICMQSGGIFPCMEMEDFPDIPNRGFYHDVTRGRILHLEELKKMADIMCSYKLNQLQLYVEHTYLFRGMSELWRDETPLTAGEILELDRYCKERHIDLVPSLASFGHLYKLLRTNTYKDFCELEEDSNEPFSFWMRMEHHTVNVSEPKSMELVKGMIEEYMGLFSSRYFNICADETFDLCKGKSSHLIQDRNVNDIYTDYVRELSEFILEKGKTPMFWGDILWNSPEQIKALPKENICLNWGYAAFQGENETRKIAETKALQYTCPGVGGWNEWVNLFENSYENISRMCTYAGKYKAIGVLNTDWGDFGHINQPEFSRPGLIYGAAFSWNTEIISFKEVNSRISVLEFKDSEAKVMEALSEIAGKQAFGWREVVLFREMALLNRPEEKRKELFYQTSPDEAEENCRKLLDVRRSVQEAFAGADTDAKGLLQKYLLGIDSIMIWNKVKASIANIIYGSEADRADSSLLAKELEEWLVKYREEWRKVSKEGDLSHITDIVCWYADILRTGYRPAAE